jgi:hypothetical protein
MGKTIRTMFLGVIVSCFLAVLLVGCGENAPGEDPNDIVEIQVFEQTLNDTINMKNYQVILKTTTTEWNALSDEDRERLARAGYAKALEQIAADETSNYNILGKTSVDVEADEDSPRSQLAFFLNREEEALEIYVDTENSGKPVVVATVATADAEPS